MKAAWVRPCFGAGGLHEVATERRHLGSGKRTPFTRPPRNRSWRPPSDGVCLATASSASSAHEQGGGDRGVRGGHSIAHGGRQRHRVELAAATKWESRRETRFSPVSFASGSPELPGALPARLRTSGERRERQTVREDEHGPQGPGRERPPRGRREAFSRNSRVAALGSGEVRVLELKCFGVQKSIGRIAGRDARGRYQAHRGHARPSSKEPQAAQ